MVGGAWAAMHRRAFSFASEKRMNVAPARQTASTRRLHEYARPAVCAFYSRGTSEIIHAGRRRWRRVPARIGQEDTRIVVTSVLALISMDYSNSRWWIRRCRCPPYLEVKKIVILVNAFLYHII